jgi:hypothetical protein
MSRVSHLFALFSARFLFVPSRLSVTTAMNTCISSLAVAIIVSPGWAPGGKPLLENREKWRTPNLYFVGNVAHPPWHWLNRYDLRRFEWQLSH